MLKGDRSISLPFCYNSINIKVLSAIMGFFVWAPLISVKSKYGSCSGSCTGLIKKNNFKT